MMNIMRQVHALLVVGALLLVCGVVHAAYLDFSPNWQAPATVGMGKQSAANIAMNCSAVQTYSNLAGRDSGVMIVAGPHTTATDNKLHLTARLYKNGNHEKSCHIYVNAKQQFASCNCNNL